MDNIKTNTGLKNGLLFGLIAIGVGLILYVINKATFLNPSLKFIFSLALPIIFVSKAALEQRRLQDGLITFQEALKPTFLTFVIGATLYAIFQYLILNLDSELLEIQHRIGIESLESMANLANLSEEYMADVRAADPMDLKPTLSTSLFRLSGQLIIGFIMAVIISLIVKRNQNA